MVQSRSKNHFFVWLWQRGLVLGPKYPVSPVEPDSIAVVIGSGEDVSQPVAVEITDC